MRVLFLNPPFHPRFSREQRSPAVTKSGTLYYPKWLATAAGVAIKNGHDVDLVDSPAAGYTVQSVIDRIAAKNIEAVICDTSTPSILNDVSVIESSACGQSISACAAGRAPCVGATQGNAGHVRFPRSRGYPRVRIHRP